MSTPREHWREGATAWRTAPRPRGWKAIRAGILERDRGRCQWPVAPGICGATATDVDHKGEPDDHTADNLWSLCSTHHDSKTARDANAVRWARARSARTPPRHPGLIG